MTPAPEVPPFPCSLLDVCDCGCTGQKVLIDARPAWHLTVHVLGLTAASSPVQLSLLIHS
jgi:hypothetical protein